LARWRRCAAAWDSLSGPTGPADKDRWLPLDLGNLRRGCAFGQLLLASAGPCWRHWRRFAPIGLTTIPDRRRRSSSPCSSPT
jgi:hypothetical protein